MDTHARAHTNVYTHVFVQSVAIRGYGTRVHANIAAGHVPAHCQHERLVPVRGCLVRCGREGQSRLVVRAHHYV